MILAWEHLAMAFRVTLVVAPVAVYFLVIGLLNSRRCPQMLTGRRDFAMMLIALSPLILLPLLQTFGTSLTVVGACAGLMVAIYLFLAPRGMTWVVYNMPISDAMDMVDRLLRRIGASAEKTAGGFNIPEMSCRIHIGGFSLLRNVSIRMEGADAAFADSFHRELGRRLSATRAETTQMAMCMLLIATAMVVIPVTMLAHRAPDIVRLLGDMMPY